MTEDDKRPSLGTPCEACSEIHEQVAVEEVQRQLNTAIDLLRDAAYFLGELKVNEPGSQVYFLICRFFEEHGINMERGNHAGK